MASWVVCPACGLRHSARPDGLCPRCRKPMDREAVATAVAPAEAAPFAPRAAMPEVYDGSVPASLRQAEEKETKERETAPFGARLAGTVMIVNGVLMVAERGLGGADPLGDVGSSTSNPARFLFSFVLGGLVLSGSAGAVKVAKVLVALSGVVIPAIFLSREQPLLAVFQLAYSASLLLLLFGNAGRVRMGLALALAAVFFVGAGAGVYGTMTGRFPLARAIMAPQLQPGAVAAVEGAKLRYRLTTPPGAWYLRTEAAAHKDNALADRWLVRPDYDAHVMVIAETLPAGGFATMSRFRETVVSNMKKSGKNFDVLDEAPFATTLESGHLVHAKSVVEGQPVEWMIGLYIQHPYIIQVLGFGNGRAFSEIATEVRGIVTSLQL